MIKIDAVCNKSLESSQLKKKPKYLKSRKKISQNLSCWRKIKTQKIKIKKVSKIILKYLFLYLFLKSLSNKLVSTYRFRKMSQKKNKQRTLISPLEWWGLEEKRTIKRLLLKITFLLKILLNLKKSSIKNKIWKRVLNQKIKG